jgi:hypothetical protein
MPNSLSANGLTVASYGEISLDLTTAMENIYGDDINVSPNSPDGQSIGIYSQMDSDALDLLVDIYNIFSVSSAYGYNLQALVEVNGLTIKGGSYTTTPVNVTASKAGTLPGLDQTAVPPYQVQDANNVWTLISSYVFSGAATQALVFQAASLGPITPLPNTITIQATPLTFVASVNNPTVTGAVIGQAAETDSQLRTRQAQSFALASTGPADAVEAALLNIPNVTSAVVSENRTGSTVGSIPAHSIWCVVVGGTPASIAQAIYAKSTCAGLVGAQSVTIVRPNGQPAVINYDIGLPQTLYAKFGIIPAVAGLTFDNTLLIQELAAALAPPYWNLGAAASIGDIVRAMFTINPQAIIVSPGVSLDGSSFSDQVAPTSAKYQFDLTASNITIT